MHEPIKKRTAIVGLFIILGLLFLVGGILTIGNLHSTFSKKMTVSTIFGDVNGLQPGNNIWFSGVKIGTVKKLEFYGKSQVKVLMNIDRSSRKYIRKDSRVKISSDGLIGNKILVIYGGTFTTGAVEEGDTLANETGLSPEDLMSTFQKTNLNVLLLTQKLVDGKGSVGRLLNSDDLYNSLLASAGSLQSATAKAQELMASLSGFSQKLNKEGTLVNDLVTDTVVFGSLKSTVLELQQIADTASVFIQHLKDAGDDPKTPVGVLLHDEQTGNHLKGTISNLEADTARLNELLDTIQHSILFRKFFKKDKSEK